MPRVTLEDETLRDGLQAEAMVWPTEAKLDLAEDLVKAGVRRLQVGSFVNPKYLPQMADTEEVIRRLRLPSDVLLTALVLNRRGLERALACGLGHLSMSVSVSDQHSRRNVRKPARQALEEMTQLIREAVAAGVTVRAGAQCAFGCVYQGAIPEKELLSAVEAMAQAGARELNLADTTGMAHPWQVQDVVGKVRDLFPEMKLSLHLHDTRGLGLANMFAGYQAGVRLFDVALGGLGGCPFVKGAAGNVPTEDAANMFEQAGIRTGIDIQLLCNVVERLQDVAGRPLPGRMAYLQRSAKGKEE